MGWAPMEPDYATCGMTTWVGSFDPLMFIYFMLATVLLPYPAYIFVATVFNWEHRAKRPARHYQDVLHATSYGVIVFIFGNYAQTLNWITILAFWITWPVYSLIAELDFAKTSLPSWKTWPFGMYALFAGATAVVLVFTAFHIYLGVVLTRTVPGFVGYYLLGLLIPFFLTMIGYACLKQQNKDMFGLSKFYNWMLSLRWRREAYVARRKFEKQQKLEPAAQKTIDSSAETSGESTGVQLQQQPAAAAGTVVVQVEGDHQNGSQHVSRTGSHDNLVYTTSRQLQLDNNNAFLSPSTEQQQQLDVTTPEFSVQPYSPYVWSAATPGYFHPHHWQLFYILAFFTRFDHWVSRVGGGIVLGCYMQGIMDLQPSTIYARFLTEFPDALTPTITTTAKPTLRWLDSDDDWIEIRRDDKDFEQIMLKVVDKSGVVHIQSGFTSWLPPISNVLIVTKPDPKLGKLTKELSIWLMETFPGITLFIDKKLQGRSSFKYQEILDLHPEWKDRMQFWSKDDCQGCGKSKKEKQIHLAVTLGGDGTVLYTTWMFQQRVPPIVAFHLGSLGFLTNFCFDSYKPTMTNIIRGEGMNLNIRMRLQCSVYKYKEVPTPASPQQQQSQHQAAQLLDANGLHSNNNNNNNKNNNDNNNDNYDSGSDDERDETRRQRVELHRKTEIMRRVKEMDSKRGTEVADLAVCHEQGQTLIHRVRTSLATTHPSVAIAEGGISVSNEEMMMPTDSWQVLNEVTVDRGSNAGMLQLELFVDGNHVTTILADGLVIATATGSTAYSLSIGGSLIHPDKNSIIISPIAPHSLTARPMIIPGTKHLRVCAPDSVMITASRYPATTICRRDQSTDWFTGLTQVLNWNSRVLQKPLESHL
ncbi:hypothetical protein BGZ95_003693 [Linnemannia exigua]|uniref:ATP-NAD kinase n=1 Tax=Linnemannia exigua TaxID=604196 RepID=A0AAD4H3I8_9FUNG|nr:hypothetical protein BGZ95_003693 [Linnemannia exigua]